MDYLKELAAQFGGKIEKQNHYDANNGHSIRGLIVKDYNGFYFRVEDFGNILKIGVKVECDFSFSINSPDSIFCYTKPVITGNFPYKLYFSSSDENLFQKTGFQQFWKFVSLKIQNIKLSENESIFIYRNWVQFSLNSNRNIAEDIDQIVDLVTNDLLFKRKTNQKILSRNIPENLRHLIPLIKKWSVPDDSEREQLIEESTDKQKNKLISSVDPYMEDINQFLDSFGSAALSDEAIFLGNLAELISELKVK